MAGNSGNVPVILLGDNFGRIVVEGAGIKLELDSGGNVTLYRNGEMLYSDGAVNTPEPASASAQPAPEDCYPTFDDVAAEPEIGELVEGKGVYVGTWEPKDKDGNSLGKIFNLYAASEDLTDESGGKVLLTFNNAVKRVADLKNWNGHDGGNFKNEQAVLQAVRDNPEALENWFIPTVEILYGKYTGENEVQTDNLYAHKYHGVLKGTFTTTTAGGFNQAHWYWSCTEHPDDSSNVYDVNFTDGYDVWDSRNYYNLSVRPVRAELRPT